MEIMKKNMQKWGKTLGIILFLLLAFISGNLSALSKNAPQTKVLGAHIQVTPTPTHVPSPTVAPITIINNIIVPTTAPTNTPQVTPTPTPIIIVVTPTPTPVVSVSQTPTPTATPTPVPQTVTIDIDYAGEHAESTYTTSMTSGESAWQAVQDAVGLANIHYTDYGGSLGIFITGFNGVDASSNQYYDFQVNGTSSNVGVSSYTVQNGDTLKFVLTNS